MFAKQAGEVMVHGPMINSDWQIWVVAADLLISTWGPCAILLPVHQTSTALWCLRGNVDLRPWMDSFYYRRGVTNPPRRPDFFSIKGNQRAGKTRQRGLIMLLEFSSNNSGGTLR